MKGKALMNVLKYLLVMLSVFTASIFLSDQTANSNEQVICKVVKVTRLGMPDQEWIVQNSRRTFLVTVTEKKIFVETISRDFEDDQQIFSIVNRNIFGIYSLRRTNIDIRSFVISNDLDEGTFVIQNQSVANVWDLKC